MANCLVTKLKSSVQDELLPKIGELIIPVDEDSRASILQNPSHVRISGSPYSIAQDGSYIKINNKYTVTELDMHYAENVYLSIEDCKYMTSLKKLNLVTNSRILKGSAKHLPSSLEIFGWMRGDVINIEDMGHLTSLTRVYSILSTYQNKDYYVGSIEEFVAAQRANGRTSCEEIVFGNGTSPISTKITYQGQELTGASKKISWTSDGTITVADNT